MSGPNTPVLVRVEHMSKEFMLPHERVSSLKQSFLRRAKKSAEVLRVLDDISFEVRQGEFFGIVGRNGSGKSTLLKLLAQIYRPTSGNITVDGRLTPFIELGVGFNPELSGRDNVYLNGAILGLTQKEIEQKFDGIIAFAELEKFIDQKLKNYSSGMMVRLAFSIAIQAHNNILLIDEVLAVGDASFQRKCFEVFKRIKQEGKTVIFVSHDMNAIREYCDRAILLEEGQIISQGHPDTVANDYLQLFNKDAGATVKEAGRWGDFKARITKPSVDTKGDDLIVSYSVSAKQTINNPILGFIIKDLDGHHLIDMNTKWDKLKTGQLAKGTSLAVSWRLPNVLKTGRYSLTTAAAHEDGYGFYDWRDDVLSFDVTQRKETAGLVLLSADVNLKRK
jgi:ABC-2 type transport system ATP-binding protein